MLTGYVPANLQPNTIRMVTAPPRPRDRPIPVLRHAAFLGGGRHRPEGSLPPLHIRLHRDPPRAADIAARGHQCYSADIVAQIKNAPDRTITVEIDHAGGCSHCGFAISRELLARTWKVRTHIAGRCASSAVLYALAGDERTIAPTGTVLIHGARRFFTAAAYAKMSLSPKAERAAIIQKMLASDDLSAAIIAARTGRSFEEAYAWQLEDRTWSASEAISNGVVHSMIGEQNGSGNRRSAAALLYLAV